MIIKMNALLLPSLILIPIISILKYYIKTIKKKVLCIHISFIYSFYNETFKFLILVKTSCIYLKIDIRKTFKIKNNVKKNTFHICQD